MNRRTLLKLAAASPLMAAAVDREARAQAQMARATRGMPSPKIKDIKALYTAPAKVPLAVVKVATDQDGLYGWGCASFTLRAQMVAAAVDKYLRPLLVGQPADRIED